MLHFSQYITAACNHYTSLYTELAHSILMNNYQMTRTIKTLILWIIIIFTNTGVKGYENRKILLIHSYHQGFDYTDETSKGIQSVFSRYGSLIDLHFEYLDCKRQNCEMNQQILLNKHKNHNFDVIIASDNDALDYTLKHRKTIYKNTPIVFCGINGYKRNYSKKISNTENITGIAEDFDLIDDLKAILHIHPNTKNITFIFDQTTTGKAIKNEIFKKSEEIKAIIDYKIYDNFTFLELQNKISESDNNNIFYMLNISRDKNDNYLSFHDVSRLVEIHTKSPVYSPLKAYINHGIIGGKIISSYEQGAKAAKMAIKVLNNIKPENITIETNSTDNFTYNYKTLKKHNINFQRLPDGSIILNQPETFYIKYKRTIVYTIGIISIALLTSMIFIIFQRKKTLELHKKKEKLKRMHLFKDIEKSKHINLNHIIGSNNLTGILIFKNNKLININKAARKIFDLRNNELNKNTNYFSQLHSRLKGQKDQYYATITTIDGISKKRCNIVTKQIDKNNNKHGTIWFLEDITTQKDIDITLFDQINSYNKTINPLVTKTSDLIEEINTKVERTKATNAETLKDLKEYSKKLLTIIDITTNLSYLSNGTYKYNTENINIIELLKEYKYSRLDPINTSLPEIEIFYDNRSLNDSDYLFTQNDTKLLYILLALILESLKRFDSTKSQTININSISKTIIFDINDIKTEKENESNIRVFTKIDIHYIRLISKRLGISAELPSTTENNTLIVLKL